jgi:RimJ/RimL family protein N-acetyltransferase
MEHFPGLIPREASDAFVDRIEAQFAERGFGPWAVEVRETSTFIGFVGLLVPSIEAHFTPAVEIGWRLAHDAWGHGYATEAAGAVLVTAFRDLGLREVVSFTVVANVRSRRVMERIGMTHDPDDDFDHPRFPVGHPICRHVLYRIRAGANTMQA